MEQMPKKNKRGVPINSIGDDLREPAGNTKSAGKPPTQCPRYRWFFTLKYDTDDPNVPMDPRSLHKLLSEWCKEFFFQLEIGEEQKYKHYQGCFSLKEKTRLNGVKDILGIKSIHLEPVSNWQASKSYCTKKETRIDGPWNIDSKFVKVITNLYPWQEEVKNELLNTEPDDRSINWVFETEGGCGKTSFIKYMASVHNATPLISGKVGDIAMCLPDEPKICLFNLTRTTENCFNYSACEQIKDGMLFSNKYESKIKIFNAPHIWCFANYKPDISCMSLDRWRFWTITDKKLVKVQIDEMTKINRNHFEPL